MDRVVGLHRSCRSSMVNREADEVWSVVASAGRGPHWYVDAAPFVFRGAVDRALGGAGRRWAVPDRPILQTGDTAGFWRVRQASGRTLVLEADVRAPGRVRFETVLEPAGGGRCTLWQAVHFEPDGLLGRVYLLFDLPAREAVTELAHRAVLNEIEAS